MNFFQRIGQGFARSSAYVAPSLGAGLFGTLGAAGGTAVAAAASKYGGNKNASAVKTRRLRALYTGTGITAAAGAVNLTTGTSISTGLFSALFGNSNETPDTAQAARNAPGTEAKSTEAAGSFWQTLMAGDGPTSADQLSAGAPSMVPAIDPNADEAASKPKWGFSTLIVIGLVGLLAVSLVRR